MSLARIMHGIALAILFAALVACFWMAAEAARTSRPFTLYCVIASILSIVAQRISGRYTTVEDQALGAVLGAFAGFALWPLFLAEALVALRRRIKARPS